jgi:flagellar basal-body rod protein FlgG
MLSQIHMAKSATFAFQKRLIMISDNVANAQTVGHKAKVMQFENMFPLVLSRSISEFEDANVPINQRPKRYMEYGMGVKVSGVTKNMNQGTIEVTNRPLDLAIQGKGYFQFRLPDGTTTYSRAGNLFQDRDGNVVDANGHPLEPSIRIPRSATQIIVNSEGKVFVQVNNEQTPQEVGQILVALFPNEEGLLGIGQNLYRETASSGAPILETPGRNVAGTVRQRALEFSNVNIIEELLAMLQVQRSFDVAIRAIKAADQMLKDGSDIKG